MLIMSSVTGLTPFCDGLRFVYGLLAVMFTWDSDEVVAMRAEYSRYYDGLGARLDAGNIIKKHLESILCDSILLPRADIMFAQHALGAVQAHIDLVQRLLNINVREVARDERVRHLCLEAAQATQTDAERTFRRVMLRILAIADEEAMRNSDLFDEFYNSYVAFENNSGADQENINAGDLFEALSDVLGKMRTNLNQALNFDIPEADLIRDWPRMRADVRTYRGVARKVRNIMQRDIRNQEAVHSDAENVEEECDSVAIGGLFPADY